MPLVQNLEALVNAFEQNGKSIRAHLNSGLSQKDIEGALVGLGIYIPVELLELYQWHNGSDASSIDAPLFGENDFYPLEEAVRKYQRVVQYHLDPHSAIDLTQCFPVGGFEGSYYLIYCSPAPFEGLLHPIVGVFQGVYIAFENLEAMILTVTEWEQNRIFDSSPVDEVLEKSIWRRFNPRVTVRTTTL